MRKEWGWMPDQANIRVAIQFPSFLTNESW